MQPRSSTLFHFTKSLDILKSLLKDGFWPRYCLEDIAWQGEEDHEFIAFPMVCFCDIPISRISEHVEFYGSYGIGLSREWGLKNGLNPVFYIGNSETLNSALDGVLDLPHELPNEDSRLASLGDTRHLLSYFKPIHGRMIIGDQPVSKEFYQESEWRYVPRHDKLKGFLRQSEFKDAEKLSLENGNSLKNCMLRFSPSDVKYIFVKTDSDIDRKSVV